tara:strand:+ start:4685 stop:6355 length:1671 start_codon:yes stop_codon:yes gene_type:complete
MQSFDIYGFNDKILKSIKELKFIIPTPIQNDVIPDILISERDIIATAQTGTGKTAAFGLPLIEHSNNKTKNIESVILCPTRELCLQITKDLDSYSKYLKNHKIIPLYGGTRVSDQIKSLKKNPKIIVCTPGRLNDLIKRNRINLSFVKHFVLDEADEMLSMGFKAEIDSILDQIPPNRRIYLFSATLSKKVKNVTKKYMNNPLMISTSTVNKAADNVRHVFYFSTIKNRYQIIKNIIDINKNIYTIVFCRTRRETTEISDKLIRDGYRTNVLNGDLSQSERDRVMKQFREKNINILVATDVASRGIDVDNLSHIINYNLPDDPEVYVHRSGRTGRAGKFGLSIVLISKKEQRKIREIEKLSKISFKEEKAPTESKILESKINVFTDKIVDAELPSNKEIETFSYLYSKLDSFTKNEVIGKFITLSKGSSFSIDTINKNQKSNLHPKDTKSGNTVKLSINVGGANKINPETIIRLVNKTTRSRDTRIGKIDINKNHSTFEVDLSMVDKIISKMNNIRHGGKKILVTVSASDSKAKQSIKKRKNKKSKKKKRNRNRKS